MDFLRNEFRDGQFTDCVCTDTLEHVPRKKRRRFVRELIRVASRRIIIGVPNPEAAPYERTLVALLKATRAGRHYVHFFSEHQKFGLPKRHEMRSLIQPQVAVEIANFALEYWIGIHLADVCKAKLDVRKLSHLHKPPAYRTFYLINKKPAERESPNT